MSRYVVSGRSTIAPTSLLPCVSLYSTTGARPLVKEIGLWNTAAVACVVALNRLSTTGTQGATLTEVPENDVSNTAIVTGFAGHTGGPTVGGELRRATLGATVGSGVIWTFDRIQIDALTTAGIGILCPTGTGQILDYYISWEE